MKLLSQLRLTQFRNYDFQSFHFSEKLIAITGNNGSGKTNLLDAIYYLCFTKSYFQSKEINNIRKGKDGFRIEGLFQKEQQEAKIVCIVKDGKKTFLDNDVPYEKLSAHIGKFCAVMIAPDDIKIINEGSENRRKFMDGIISQADAGYLENLLHYQKIQGLKHAYLKQLQGAPADYTLLQVYNEQLCMAGEALVKERKRYTLQLRDFVQQFYTVLSAAAEQINMQYIPGIQADNWKPHLAAVLPKEIYAGRSLAGAHLDEWEFSINGMPFKTQASQGQKKSLLIALKMAQLQMLNDLHKNPFLLLDDIFEKLDARRIHQLFDLIQKMELSQIFLTHTSKEDVLKHTLPFFPTASHIEL